MSEQLHSSHEKQHEALDLSRESQENLKRIQENAEAENVSPEKIEELQSRVEKQAFSGKEITIGEHEQPKQQTYTVTQKELKVDAYKRTLQKVRKHLNAPEKALSRLVHQPTVETFSNVGSKTLARPSGLLGGGIVSVAGSSTLLYMAKHYGFHYNFFVFFVLFVGGFALGMVSELIIRLILHPR
jgi:hypothetical protein